MPAIGGSTQLTLYNQLEAIRGKPGSGTYNALHPFMAAVSAFNNAIYAKYFANLAESGISDRKPANKKSRGNWSNFQI